MRVRNMAVVGAALVAAWAGGTGIAQATPDTSSEPSCSDLTTASVLEEGSADIDPCDIPVDCVLTAAGTEDAGEAARSDFPCSGDDITIDVEGDCANPETFTFIVNATELVPNGKYNVLLFVDQPSAPAGPDLVFPFTADSNGDVDDYEYTETESAGGFDFPAGAFTLDWLAGGDFEGAYPTIGSTDVEECKPVHTDPVVTQPTTPTTPVEAPAAAPAAAPVVVVPAAAHPAVLANTGTPVTAAALLGGGLVLAGAGALVATRRRAS